MIAPLAANECLMFLIRHGATDCNLARPPRLQGRTDTRLSELGRQQAERTGQFLSGRGIEAVFSSPLVRARQTAEFVASPYGLEIATVDALTEVDVGDWEGRDWNDIMAAEPEAYRAFMENPADNGYTGGETMQDVLDRALPAFETLLAENLGRRIAVVAHNVVNRTYTAHLLGLPIAKSWLVAQDNCGISVVRLRNGKTKIKTANAVFHLEGPGDSI